MKTKGLERTGTFKERKRIWKLSEDRVILKPLKDFKQENDTATAVVMG